MRGSLVHKGKNKWALVLEMGRVAETLPDGTVVQKRKQKWHSFTGTRKEAGDKLTELVRQVNRDEYVPPTKQTVGEWLTEWLEKTVKTTKRPRTFAVYKSIINGSLAPALGDIPLQKLKPIDVQQYYATHADLSAATLNLHTAVLSAALKSALKNGQVSRNVVALADGKPRVQRGADDLAANVLDLADARKLIAAAKAMGTRQAAFYGLALDAGARLSELAGLKWTDFDLDAGRVTLVRQLGSSTLAEDGTVVFGPLKTGRSRSIDLSADTVTLLKEHKRAQAELKMKNRATWRDLGLVFTREAADCYTKEHELGMPLPVHNIGAGEFARVLKAADVKRISFHGLRHTSATLLLLAGESPKVVSERLGHAKISVTMDTYSHVLPTMGKAAAERIGALLHG